MCDLRFLALVVLFSFSSIASAYVTCTSFGTASSWGAAYDTGEGQANLYNCGHFLSDQSTEVWACGYWTGSSWGNYCITITGNPPWQDYDSDGIPDDRDPPPPDPGEPPTCPVHQHAASDLNGGWYCAWDDTTCPGGEGWYPDGGVCKPAGQTQCTPTGGIYEPDGGGFCQPSEPAPETCPWDTRFDPVTGKCVYTGEISGGSNPSYPACSPTMPTPDGGGCYDPYDPTAPIYSVPPFCNELPPNSPPNTPCRNPDGSEGHPSLTNPQTGAPYAPPQGGSGSYKYCPVPIPSCSSPAYACLNESGHLQQVPSCGTGSNSDGGGSTPIGGGSGSGGGGGAIGGGGIGGGANGGSRPGGSHGGSAPGPSGSPDEIPVPDPTGTPGDPNAPGDVAPTDPGSSGGEFGSGGESPGTTAGQAGGYADAIELLCDGGSCADGPSCDKDFCSASERINNIMGYFTPKTQISAPAECPPVTFDFSDVPTFSFIGHAELTSHCDLLESNRAIIKAITDVLVAVTFIFIVLDA